MGSRVGAGLGLRTLGRRGGSFSRFVIFQIGADNYSSTRERKMALGNEAGTLLRSHPAILVQTSVDRAECRVSGGLGWVPVTFSGLTDCRGFTLSVDGRALDQSVHGKDFWQSDFDPESRTWSLSYNIPFDGLKSRHLLLSR